jgi:hypothetical protein
MFIIISFRLGSRGKAGAQQEKPILKGGGASRLQIANHPPGPKYAEASVILCDDYFCSGETAYRT